MKKAPISVTHPEIAAQLKDQSLADVLTYGSIREVWWVCDRSHEWEARVANRTRRLSGCPYCAGQRAIPGETDLGTLRPDLACELKDQSLASSLAVSSNKRVWWRCKTCANEWEAEVKSRTRGDGCPACAQGGFDLSKPSWVYVVSQPPLHNEDPTVVKLGISNLDNLERRLTTHARQGLTEVLALSAYPRGNDALTRERTFKRYLRDLPLEHRVTKDELPDGYTEAFLSSAPDWEVHAFI